MTTNPPQTALDDGGPFHPIPENRDPVTGMGICEGWRGATLRDHFAGQIAAGMAAFSGTAGVSYGPDEIAGRAYQVADALLRARLKHEADGGAL